MLSPDVATVCIKSASDAALALGARQAGKSKRGLRRLTLPCVRRQIHLFILFD